MASKNLTAFKRLLSRNQRIGLDSMCFIYQYSNHPKYSPLTNIIFQKLSQKQIKATTSAISIIETLVLPERNNQIESIQKYQKVFEQLPNLVIISVDYHLALITSKLRAIYPKIRTPDAIQIGAAILNECKIFITNDKQLKQVKQIQVKILSDYI